MKQEYIQGKWYWFEFKYEYPCIARVNGTTISCSEFALQASDVYTENGVGGFKEHTFFEKDCKGLATTDQIETCLKAYARKNGYMDGAKIKGMYARIGPYRLIEPFEYLNEDILADKNGITIYKDGKWAEIVAHAPSVQDKQDQELTESIHEYLTNQDLEKMSVLINGHSVSLLKCVEVYQLCLGIKTIIG